MKREGAAMNSTPEGDGFLSRWSRRKLERSAAAANAPASPEPAALPPPAEADERPRDPETGEPIDEELVASLPSIDQLREGADVSGFMRRGVPEALRRDALRALWTSDPTIRDYVSPALDYAYDYNAPGGAPGYGPLTESDIAQAKDFMANLFSDPPAEQEASGQMAAAQETGARDNAPQEPAQESNAGPAPVGVVHVAVRKADKPAPGAPEAIETETAQNGELGGPDDDAAFVQRNKDRADELRTEDREAPRRRRGGGATPV
jgi:hypothetical protein